MKSQLRDTKTLNTEMRFVIVFSNAFMPTKMKGKVVCPDDAEIILILDEDKYSDCVCVSFDFTLVHFFMNVIL